VHCSLEALISAHHHPTSSLTHALLFNSGYDANLSLTSSLPLSHDVCLLDSEIHNSVHMGLRMGRVKERNVKFFKHNDVDDFGNMLDGICREIDESNAAAAAAASSAAASHPNPGVFVFLESYYSMSGTLSPLTSIFQTLSTLSEVYPNIPLGVIVDEAHSTGIFGDAGRGLTHANDLHEHPNLVATLHTFGKAYGSHGAVVIEAPKLQNTLTSYLVNYARPLIYSTSLPPSHVEDLIRTHNFVASDECDVRRDDMFENINTFVQMFQNRLSHTDLSLLQGGGPGPIQSILTGDGGPEFCVSLSKTLKEDHNILVYPIRYPTVERGKERLRVIVHAKNTKEEIERLVEGLSEAYCKLRSIKHVP
jgi:8-amino-7-oxononanoate synthase